MFAQRGGLVRHWRRQSNLGGGDDDLHRLAVAGVGDGVVEDHDRPHHTARRAHLNDSDSQSMCIRVS